jgi:O-antigen/teichoic acid export membrane protein
MSRIHKAATIAAFNYMQYALAIVTGLIVVPLTLHHLGARTWGLWLASGEILNYAGMVDLGVLTALPWMFAEAEGRRDREAMRRFVSLGVWLGVLVAAGYAVAALVLWRVLPSALFLTADDRRIIAIPLTIVVIANMMRQPFGAFRAVLVGMQDVVFNGFVTIAGSAASVTITIVLLIRGYGLYALAWAAALPPLAVLMACAIRALVIAPDLRPGWIRPRVADLRRLLTQGVGGWLGDAGWQLMAASNAIVITYMGHPEWVPIYACTAKLAGMCTQLVWVLPDSGQVGLAQVHGEGRIARVRQVIALMLRLHLLLAGAAACGLLVFNPAFVTRWVGPAVFGGLTLNALLAFGVMLSSIVHGLQTSAAVLGHRMRVGAVVLVNGLVQTVLAIVLGHRVGLIGVAWASLAASMLTSLPAGIVLLRDAASFTPAALVSDLLTPWLVRIAPVAAVAILAGLVSPSLGIWWSAGAAVLVCAAYVWQARPLLADLADEPRIGIWLQRSRLLASPAPAIAAPAAAVNEPYCR